MHPISAWLAGPREFEPGRLLFDQYGESQILRYLFAAGETEYAAGRLAQALQQLLPAALNTPPYAPSTPPYALSAPAGDAGPAAGPADPPAGQELASLQAGLKNLYQVRSHCHSQLETAGSREARAALAGRILETGREIEALLHQRQYLQQFGQLPPDPAGPGRDLSSPAALILEINRLRVRISKARKKPEKAAQVLAWQQQVKEYQKILHKPADK